jgi:organic radical activating enzyme
LVEIKNEWELKQIRGVTITGGEPFQQMEGLIQLVKGIKKI